MEKLYDEEEEEEEKRRNTKCETIDVLIAFKVGGSRLYMIVSS